MEVDQGPPAEAPPAAEATPAPAAAEPAAPAQPPAPPVVAPPAAPEPPKETEEDAPKDARPKIKEPVTFLTKDTTLNFLHSDRGNVLMALSDSGLQYLLAGGRANVGVKSGRYFFEVKLVEILNPTQPTHQRAQPPIPRQLLRVGFGTERSGLFVGEDEEQVSFDSEGNFISGRKPMVISQKFARDQSLGVLLNLDKSSPNYNTISLFRDGVRACQPQKLPEILHGKSLFPVITFRNLTIHVNFGPTPAVNLPFTCAMLGEAATADVEVKTEAAPPGGKYEVVFPVSLPDEGTFEWLDLWLKKNPQYTEISDRKILEWAEKSGLPRQKGYAYKASNDKPDLGMGFIQLDDGSVKRALQTVAASQPRHLLIMEVKSLLVPEERKELFKKFNAPHLKRLAKVVIGNPDKTFKDHVLALLLKQKQDALDQEHKVKNQELVKKKIAEIREKKLAREKRLKEKAAKEAAKKAEEEKKAAAKAAAAAAGEEPKEEEAEKKDEEMPPAEEEEPEEEEEKEEDAIKAIIETPAPKAVLTKEDEKAVFPKLAVPDLLPQVLAASFTNFSLPEKSEGVEDVTYEWSKAAESAKYLKEWILNKKVVTRIEDLQPQEWFQKQLSSWVQTLQKLHKKQVEWKEARKQYLLYKKKKAEEAPKEEAKPMEVDGEKPEGEAPKEEEKAKSMEVDGEKPEGEAPKEEKKEETGPPPVEELDEDGDVFGVADVFDAGNGTPLFANWTVEDWALLTLRVELHLLAHSFKRDTKDPERIGIHTDLFQFYYTKYFRKVVTFGNYGVKTAEELLALISDTVVVTTDKHVIEAQLSDELDSFNLFVKLTEEARRERTLLIDSGNDAVALKFNVVALNSILGLGVGAPSAPGPVQGKGYSKGLGKPPAPPYNKGYSGGKGFGSGPVPPPAPPPAGKGFGKDFGGGGKGYQGGYGGGKGYK